MYVIHHCLFCRPSDSTVAVSQETGIEPRTVATSALTARRSNPSAGSHLLSARYHPLSAGFHPLSARSYPHSAISHPLLVQISSNSARSHPHSARSHPRSARSHPQSARSHPPSAQISSTSIYVFIKKTSQASVQKYRLIFAKQNDSILSGIMIFCRETQFQMQSFHLSTQGTIYSQKDI